MQTIPRPNPNPAIEHDPIAKFRLLVPRLKESLVKLMDVGAMLFYQNSLSDNCMRPIEAIGERFDKCLEEFYAICDQMEYLLRLALECVGSSADSLKFTPQQVTAPQQQIPNTLTFSQYLHIVKTQIASARQIHDKLVECTREPSLKPNPMSGAATQQSGVGQQGSQQSGQQLSGQ